MEKIKVSSFIFAVLFLGCRSVDDDHCNLHFNDLDTLNFENFNVLYNIGDIKFAPKKNKDTIVGYAYSNYNANDFYYSGIPHDTIIKNPFLRYIIDLNKIPFDTLSDDKIIQNSLKEYLPSTADPIITQANVKNVCYKKTYFITTQSIATDRLIEKNHVVMSLMRFKNEIYLLSINFYYVGTESKMKDYNSTILNLDSTLSIHNK